MVPSLKEKILLIFTNVFFTIFHDCQQIFVQNFQGNSNINHLLWIGSHRAWNWIYLIWKRSHHNIASKASSPLQSQFNCVFFSVPNIDVFILISTHTYTFFPSIYLIWHKIALIILMIFIFFFTYFQDVFYLIHE